jgi:hypothetical protein
MDPRAFTKKGYDTDLLILRTLFALNPNTNLPISSFYVATTDGIGGLYWLSAIDYISAATGIGNLPSSITYLSTGLSSITGNYTNFSTYVSSVIIQGLSSLSTAIGNVNLSGTITPLQLTSSIQGLGTTSYISSLSLTSTVQGLGTASYVSTSGLVNFTTSTLLSSVNWFLSPDRYISTGNLLSTSADFLFKFQNLDLGSNISTVNIYGTANLSNVSIGIFNYYNQDVSTLSTAVGIQLYTLSSAIYDNKVGYITSTNLVSTVQGLGTNGYISTLSLLSSLEGIGTLGYFSTTAVTSTIDGLATTGYLSTLSLISTVTGLGTLGYISSQGATQTALTSSILGLGTANFLSSLSLVSTIEGLGTFGYISSVNATQNTLTSTIIGLGTVGYISTFTSASTIKGLGTAGYISTSQFYSSFANILSSSNYISTGNLASTSIGLQNTFSIYNGGTIFVTGGILNVTNANGNIVYLSSFLYSSITYKGENSILNPLVSQDSGTVNSNLLFSSATLQLDTFSSFINSKSLVTIEAYPSLFFTNLAYTFNSNKSLSPINVSSFIQFGKNYFSSQMSQTMFYPLNDQANYSNLFTPTIKISLPGSMISNVYNQRPFNLSHYMPQAISHLNTNGLANSNTSLFFPSTNSVFLSIQNLPP